ncbi:G-type lectin S-receptor-like serine/threonine-protein kinase At4g27290 [Gastrolobium bilobum]|uniref:G-type lectin S-receptor-like serine/threonine-protein kinase At4g27290 n=1 Tax=Gastrolobium bilobum TaxID=150636 RepID=UPI002AAFBC43|nr:G-type lectin S-receptor-like serine/threonine-protein kinase At4g27290 [Gastrolobium bilobum]
MKIVLFLSFFLFSYVRTCTSLDSLAVSQSIQDGQTLVSVDGTFEVGFFTPGNSASRYLGVWYRNLSPLTVVWVANRETPLQNNSGVLKLNEDGVLVLLNSTNSTVWSSKISKETVNNPIVQLLDSGNLVLKNGKDTKEDQILWQSFDYPCDTLLPGMKLGWNLVTGLDRFLTSWKSADDPARGEFSVHINIGGYPQLVFMKGSVIKSRIGSWNGLGFTGYPIQPLIGKQRFIFVVNAEEVYHQYEVLDSTFVSIYTLSPSGLLRSLAWTSKTSDQKVIETGLDSCDIYAMCGANSICNMNGNVPKCECLGGYVPNFPEQWNISFWAGGCVSRNNSTCKNRNSSTDGFWKYKQLKIPDTSSSWYSTTMNLEECHKSCLKNCSCTAYANLDVRNGGSGCLLWFHDLVDTRIFSQWGQDLYIRVPASEQDQVADNGHGYTQKKMVGITIGWIIFGFITCVSMLILRKRGKFCIRLFQWRQEYFRLRKDDMDLPTFDLSIIAKATNNFSSRNKLGEGGFGPVYKGTLIDGQEVAVKRHSKKSDQGLEEFKNEVALIAKLQHRNLVKLLGCCIEGEEKMLIYEYMPNKSLDYFIFDETRRKLFAWLQRFHIIGGVARGLLYLHEDSRLRIIHRDLKTSNILLDAHMNPKISDFGLARTFGEDQIQAKTKKLVGTYGYMPPEYAVHGHYSVKSDVFSFGVIVLEIISGKKNRGFSDPEHSLNLLGHAWRLWTEDRPLELIDKHLRQRCILSEVLRCIHVGLLCTQQKPVDRPDMSSVILMLNGEKLLPQPNPPGFYTGRSLPESISLNEMSLTIFEAR